MVLEVIIAILLFLAGALLYTFGILRVLLCYTSAIPLTRELKARYPGRVAAGAIYMKIAYTTVFWPIITVAATLDGIGWGLDYSLLATWEAYFSPSPRQSDVWAEINATSQIISCSTSAS